MAIRTIRTMGDRALTKVCKPVEEVNEKIATLIDDMFDTMYDMMGVGLAAPQIGILKRIVVIDVGDENAYVLINPKIISREGEQTGDEGCLSLPGKVGTVTRPEKVTVAFLDEQMQECELTGTGLLARAICHECDHLDGIMYVDHVEGTLRDTAVDPEDFDYDHLDFE